MTTAKAINCKNCGSSLKLYIQSRKIYSITCDYCGSVHDVQNEFKLLGQFLNSLKPNAPLKPGMSGKIKDISFMIIGEVLYSNYLYEKKEQIPSDNSWIDYQLYSKTHGFATLTMEGGHFVFSRRIRDIPSFSLRTSSTEETFTFRDKEFKVFEKFNAVVNYVSGELTWIAQAGDQTHVIDAISPPYLLSLEESESELEYYFGEYIDEDEIYDSFGIKDENRLDSVDVHATEPFQAKILRPLSYVALPTAILSLVVLFILFIFGRGDLIYTKHFLPSELKQPIIVENSIHITDIQHLISMNLQSRINNNWAFFNVSLLKDKEPIVQFGKEISYYHGWEGGEHWSEGSQEATIQFKVPEVGFYTLQVNAENISNQTLSVSIKQNVWSMRYFLGLFIFSLCTYLWYYYEKFAFENSKWNEEDPIKSSAIVSTIIFFVIAITVFIIIS